MLKYPGMQDQGGHNPHQGSVKVGIVVDAVACIPGCPGAIDQKENAKQPGRHRDNEKYSQHGFGLKKDIRKQYGTDRSRSTQTAVDRIVFVFDKGSHITQHQAQHIDQGKLQMPPGTYTDQHGLQGKAKEIKGNHVEQQMPPVPVHHATGQNGIDAFAPVYAVRMQHEFPQKIVVGECINTGHDGKCKNDAGNGGVDKIIEHGQ